MASCSIHNKRHPTREVAKAWRIYGYYWAHRLVTCKHIVVRSSRREAVQCERCEWAPLKRPRKPKLGWDATPRARRAT